MRHYIVGCDLGQAFDFSAIAVLQRDERPLPATPERTGAKRESAYQVRHLERLPLGTSYPTQVEKIAALMRTVTARSRQEQPIATVQLVVDQTGVGRPVVDMLRQAGQKPIAVSIHGGDATSRDGMDYRVPKRELVSVVQVLLQSQRLQIANALPDAETLAKEMLAFKVQISAAGHDSYGNDWRENAHDDMVLAVAMAAWLGERAAPAQRPPQSSWSTRTWT